MALNTKTQILDQSYTSLNQGATTDGNTGNGIGNLRRATNNNIILGQSFIPSINGYCTRIDLYLQKIGAPTGNIWTQLGFDCSDPTAFLIPNSKSSLNNVASVPTSYTWTEFDLPTPILVTAQQRYWILLNGDYTIAVDVGVYASIDTSSPTYLPGSVGRWGNGNAMWELINSYDMWFKEYVLPIERNKEF